MDVRVLQLVDHLLLIERELHVLGWWSPESPAQAELASQEPFCVDTLAFEQWLQWVFLPRMKIIIEQDLPLPSVSGIQQMAEMVYADRPGQAGRLLQLLGAFDHAIIGGPD